MAEPYCATSALLNQIRSLGFHVSTFRVPMSLMGCPGHVELHAVNADVDPPEVHIARVGDEEQDDDPFFRAACLLAESVGLTWRGELSESDSCDVPGAARPRGFPGLRSSSEH